MFRLRSWLLPFILAVITFWIAIACNNLPSSREMVIRVGSKNVAEQWILGEMYALALEDHGFTVERHLNLPGTTAAHNSLTRGEVDLYPEYTGTALLSVLKLPGNSDRQVVYETVKESYQEQFNLIWLAPSPMSNTQALVMTPQKSQDYGITTLSDLVAQADRLVMVGPPEFQEKEDGLPGIEEVYGPFTLKDYLAVSPEFRYSTLMSGDAHVAVGSSTDGEISAFKLVMLQDDKNFFPPYQVAPVVRANVLKKHPELEDILDNITTQITDSIMQDLNYEVTGKQQDPAMVAHDFLQKIQVLGRN
ncbi:quaternary ammonium transporter [Spirulina subsalsa FACHB-351]|uniref:Quaternary ammonium transporter n=1 Tax=Spirulina subsalsa FACHB-351 TaxID=234711 RepID=A0ABT3L0A3_9CYAN|nr:glycine betaine ABC transporter substrate-binding protein [Spirulina subsalsa]MCW6034933.1 quaternary ammonium transporter [Spirulina subsalsa FACHB-351]